MTPLLNNSFKFEAVGIVLIIIIIIIFIIIIIIMIITIIIIISSIIIDIWENANWIPPWPRANILIIFL